MCLRVVMHRGGSKVAVKANIIKIGNSQGVRIPKPLLEQTGLTGEVELEVVENHIVIRPRRHPREGWEEQFRLMHERGDDRLLDAEPPILTHYEKTEWEW